MKKYKSIKQKFSEFGVILLIIAGMFFFFKSRWNSKKQASILVESQKMQQEGHKAATAESTSAEGTVTDPETELPAQNAQVKYEEVKSTSENRPDPLMDKITTFSNEINKKFEERLRDMFKNERKEEFMDSYLALRLERTMRMRELQKTDNSRAANVKVTYEFHNKLYQVIGKNLYIKYLKILKETNDESKKTKIILEF